MLYEGRATIVAAGSTPYYGAQAAFSQGVVIVSSWTVHVPKSDRSFRRRRPAALPVRARRAACAAAEFLNTGARNFHTKGPRASGTRAREFFDTIERLFFWGGGPSHPPFPSFRHLSLLGRHRGCTCGSRAFRRGDSCPTSSPSSEAPTATRTARSTSSATTSRSSSWTRRRCRSSTRATPSADEAAFDSPSEDSAAPASRLTHILETPARFFASRSYPQDTRRSPAKCASWTSSGCQASSAQNSPSTTHAPSNQQRQESYPASTHHRLPAKYSREPSLPTPENIAGGSSRALARSRERERERPAVAPRDERAFRRRKAAGLAAPSRPQ